MGSLMPTVIIEDFVGGTATEVDVPWDEVPEPVRRLIGDRAGRAAASARRAYSPDQERDDHGRFGQGSGDGSPVPDPIGDATGAMMERVLEPDGGMTLTPLTGQEPSSGIVVAREGFSKAIPVAEFTASREACKEYVKDYLRANAAEFDKPGSGLGLWHNPDSGNVVLDVVDVVQDRAEGLRLGAERDQIAVYDIDAGDVVSTGGTGGGQAAVSGPGARYAAQAREPDDRGRARRVRRAGSRRVPGRAVTAEVTRARKTLERLARIRRDGVRQLLAGAEIAFAEAMRHAGVRATTKARNRSGQSMARTVATAYETHQSLAPFFAALGVTESDLLAGSFASYEEQARRWLEARQAERADAAGDYVRDDDGADERITAAAAFLAAALLALARRRILSGQDPIDLSSPGEVAGAIPTQLAVQALRIADGLAVATPAATADLIPAVSILTNVASLEQLVFDGLRERLTLNAELAATPDALEQILTGLGGESGAGHEYRWVHGFYGDPKTTFEPHVRLDGEEFIDTESDPRLVNDGDWPETTFFYPGDHLGCTCELVLQVPYGVDAPVADFDAGVPAQAALGSRPPFGGGPDGARLAGWSEEDHPRDAHGQFSSGDGAEAAAGDDPLGGRTDHGLTDDDVRAGRTVAEEIDHEWGDGAAAEWAANAPPGISVADWSNYNYLREEGGPAIAIRMAEEAAQDYNPSGAAALDALTPDDDYGYSVMQDQMDSATRGVGSYIEASVQELAAAHGDDPEQLDALMELAAYVTTDSTELRAEVAASLRDEVLEAARGEEIVTFQTAPAVAGILASGVIANEAMLDGQVGNYTGQERAEAERERIGVPLDAKPEDRPVYGTFSKGDEVEEMGSGVVYFGEGRVTLDSSVLDRSTIGMGDLLHVGTPLSYPWIESSRPETNQYDADTLIGMGSDGALAGSMLSIAYDRIESILGDAGAQAMLESVSSDHPEWAQWRADDYIEVQVHGGVSLADVKEIGLPSADEYRSGTSSPIENQLGWPDAAAEAREFIDLHVAVSEAEGPHHRFTISAGMPSLYEWDDGLSERREMGL